MNSILAIHPYKTEGVWVFDDPKVGLVQEPFVSGADDIIERMVSAQLGMQGWLCPALFKYFDAAPQRIYAQFKSKRRANSLTSSRNEP